MSNADLKTLQEKLGYQFKDEKNLKLALVHPSWIEEMRKPTFESNERLEFLGDSVLNLAIAGVLYQKFPDIPDAPARPEPRYRIFDSWPGSAPAAPAVL